MTIVYAPGKVILFGEHAVVYGQPALAIPVQEVRACASITEIEDAGSNRFLLCAPDIEFEEWLNDIEFENPLGNVVRLSMDKLGIVDHPSIKLEISSTVPIASGMGSSAAISIAIIRALGQYFNSPFSSQEQSQIAFEIEKLHHGTPSGVDNTVIAFEKPVFFKHGEDPSPFDIGAPITLIIADSGTRSLTSEAVGQVRVAWSEEPGSYAAIFDQIGSITRLAKQAIKAGQIHILGSLMNQNQELLRALKVSSPGLENLIKAALENGALGAKLSGAGLGGNMLALVTEAKAQQVIKSLQKAGASQTLLTVLEK